MTVQILVGDVRDRLADLGDGSVHCVVTSPPYLGLRNYGTAEWLGGAADCDHVVGEIHTGLGMAALGAKYRGGGKKAAAPKPLPAKGQCPRCGAVRIDDQIGSETTPAEYIATMVEVFREVRRVLRDDGTLWLNLGDSFANSHGSEDVRVTESDDPSWHGGVLANHPKRSRSLAGGFKAKDLMMLPARVALALQGDGWYVRQMLPWVKRNPMPESAKDRPTSAVEYVFMLTKSRRYFYDYEAVKRQASEGTNARLARNGSAAGSTRANGGMRANGPVKALAPTGWDTDTGGARHGTVHKDGRRKQAAAGSGIKNNTSMDAALAVTPDNRAFRNSDLFFDSLAGPFGAIVDDAGAIIALDVTSQGYSEAHFATFPPKLVEPLIVASSRPGDVVLDPFGGAGTTGLVAERLGRDAILIELNPGYAEMARYRIGLFADVRREAAQ